MNDPLHHAPARVGPIARRARSRSPAWLLALVAAVTQVLPLVAPLAINAAADANENHPRWKEFVTWLTNKKRTPDEDLVLRYILSGGNRFTWFDVYAHSMQEQTEAMFRRWLARDGNPRRSPDLGHRANGDPKP